MAKYLIITSCTAITEYVIEANSVAEAEEKYSDGEYLSEKITDYQNEEIDDIKLESEA